MTVRSEHPAPGVATVSLGAAGRRLTYTCEPDAHRVAVTDDSGRVLLAFGGRGRGPGALDTPLDLTFVRPIFAGERLPLIGADAIWLAVADYGNRRVQIFELDGAPVGAIDTLDHPELGAPCGVSWQAPILEIEGVEGARARVYLSAALLCGSTHAVSTALLPREWLTPSDSVN
jgi:hypothetical protein